MVWVSSERGVARSARGEWPKEKSKLTEIKRPTAGPALRFLCSLRLLASFPCRLSSSAGLAFSLLHLLLLCLCLCHIHSGTPPPLPRASGSRMYHLKLHVHRFVCSPSHPRALELDFQAFNLMRGGQRDILEAHTDTAARPLGLSKHVASLLQKPVGELKKQTSSVRATVESRKEASDSFPILRCKLD